MKKLIGIMTAFIAVFSLTACGEEEKTVEEPKAAEEQVAEQKNVTREFGNISIDMPSTFEEVKEQDGLFVSGGPNASIVAMPLEEVELAPTEWNEEVAAGSLELLYGEAYSDMELAAFEGNIDMNGSPAVYYSFYGTAEDGQERLVHIVRLFNTDITEQYLITFMHLAEDESFNADVSGEIINSITLSPEA